MIETSATRYGPGMSTILNAIRNASFKPVGPDEVVTILRGGAGERSHVRALFSDVSLPVLEEVSAGVGVPFAALLAHYKAAKADVAVINAEFEEVLAGS